MFFRLAPRAIVALMLLSVPLALHTSWTYVRSTVQTHEAADKLMRTYVPLDGRSATLIALVCAFAAAIILSAGPRTPLLHPSIDGSRFWRATLAAGATLAWLLFLLSTWQLL